MASRDYKIYDERYPHFITLGIRFGLPLFSDPQAAGIILDNLAYLREKQEIKLIAYVIMENHLHAILQGKELQSRINRFKSYSARKIIDLFEHQKRSRWLKRLQQLRPDHKTDRRYQLWKRGCHPKQLEGDDMMLQKIDYIHQNPVRRGYVDRSEDWRYSSLRNYLGAEGLIEIDKFEGRGRVA